MSDESLLLDIRNLECYFRAAGGGDKELFKALDGVCLKLRHRSFHALVGESGSGKSVTALAIGGLVRPKKMSGEIFFEGRDGKRVDLMSLTRQEMAKRLGREIAYVFQDPGSSLNPVLKVGEQIAETYLAHNDDCMKNAKDRSIELLLSVKIKEPERIYSSFPHELSGGMKQRAMIAMALVCEPRLLVADEPTTALDVVTQKDLLDLLRALGESRSMAVLFITHHLGLACRYADEITMLEKGKVVELIKSPGAGIEPRHAYSRRLFAAQLHHATPKSRVEV